jgi:hypothetical protein
MVASGQPHAPVPTVQEAEWAPGPVCGLLLKISLAPGFDTRTVQAVASSHAYGAIPV